MVFFTEQLLAKWDWPLPSFILISRETASNVLGAIAAASMSALVMVYSIVLLVYTLAAGSIGPRLLQRFCKDRVNQIAVGSLGATFLYSIFAMWLIRNDASGNLAVGVAILHSIISVLLLQLFVHTVSTRVTIDQETARISGALDRQIDKAIEVSANLHYSEVVLRDDVARKINSPGTGYVNSIEADLLVKTAEDDDAVIVFAVQPGDVLVVTDVLAWVYGNAGKELEVVVQAAAPLIPARDPSGEIRFSVHLLVQNRPEGLVAGCE